MNIKAAHQAWANYVRSHPKHAHRVQRVGSGDDLSLFAEYLAGAYLLDEGHILLKAEFFRDRVLSPRRRDRAKTCDFEMVGVQGRDSLFVEVKHAFEDSKTSIDYSNFLKSAYLKGARCLVAVLYSENTRTFSDVTVDDLNAEDWCKWLPPKQILKYRRNGLVSLIQLNIS